MDAWQLRILPDHSVDKMFAHMLHLFLLLRDSLRGAHFNVLMYSVHVKKNAVYRSVRMPHGRFSFFSVWRQGEDSRTLSSQFDASPPFPSSNLSRNSRLVCSHFGEFPENCAPSVAVASASIHAGARTPTVRASSTLSPSAVSLRFPSW